MTRAAPGIFSGALPKENDMNWPHVHLILNHLPVIGLPAGLLLLAWGLMRKSEDVKRVGLIAFAIVADASLAVYISGGRAEDVVEHLPGVSEAMIDTHSSAAGFALTGSLIVGAAALAGLFLFRRAAAFPRWFVLTMLGLSLVVSAVFVRTANLGGEIRHTVIRSGAQPTTQEDKGEGEKERGRDRNKREDEKGHQ